MIVLKQENQLMTLTFDACSLHFERNSLISLPIGADARTTPILRRIRLAYFPKMRISVQGRARASSMPSYAGGMLLFLSERITYGKMECLIVLKTVDIVESTLPCVKR